MNRIFLGQTAIISGGLGDIGRAIALDLASQGANIAIGDLHPENQAAEFLSRLNHLNVQADYTQVDVTEPQAVSNWVINAERSLGVASLIIANAAIVTFTTLQEMTAAQWSRELRVNLDGAFHLTHSATARLIFHGRPGRVVFIGSWAAHTVHTHIPAYCVSKAGMRMLSKCMALELAPRNILVNEIAPGYVDAGLSGRSFEKDAQAREDARLKVPVKRLISAEEVAQQVTILCHPANIHMTGTVVVMDGGLSLQH